MIAVGVARPIAHGQAMTTTPMNAVSASVMRGSGPNASHTTNVPAATTRTIGTKTSAMRSARRWIGALLPWARLTRSTMRASAVSRPTRVARITNVPVVLRVAPMTSAPAVTSTGIGLAGEHAGIDRGRPLDHHAVDRAAARPGRTRSRSPTATASSATSSSRPSVDAPGDRGLQSDEPPDRPGRAGLGAVLEPPAQQDEPDDDRGRVEVGLRMQPGLVDDVRKEGDEATLYSQAALVPTATRVSMLAARCRAARHAAR